MQQHEKHTISEVLGLLCATLQTLLRKLHKSDVVQISDQVMQILLYMLNAADQGGVQEDTLLAIDALINSMWKMHTCAHSHTHRETPIRGSAVLLDDSIMPIPRCNAVRASPALSEGGTIRLSDIISLKYAWFFFHFPPKPFLCGRGFPPSANLLWRSLATSRSSYPALN